MMTMLLVVSVQDCGTTFIVSVQDCGTYVHSEWNNGN